MTKAKAKTPTASNRSQLPQEEIQKHQEGQQRYQEQRKQHKNKQLKLHQQQQLQQKQQHHQEQGDDTHNIYEQVIIMPTPKKIYSKIIVAKPYEDVKSSNTKYVHELRDKIVVSFIYNFFFIDYFCFVSFIVHFTFFALESSGKLATMCSSIFLIALSGSRV